MTKEYIEESLRQTDRQYSNCVSLGWFCGTASSMAKLGLRSFSSPFDWCYSEYRGVLAHLEEEFSNFLLRENLVMTDKITTFRDKKYGIDYPHDMKENLDAEYEGIYERYTRRIARFMKAIQSPTVFFRVIRDQQEIAYINENWKYAEKLVKRYNPKNHIIYAKRKGLVGLVDCVEAYDLDVDQYRTRNCELRYLFDFSERLIERCSGLIDIGQMENNYQFDHQSYIQIMNSSYIGVCVEYEIDGCDDLILAALDAARTEGIYLWGAGACGLPLASYLKRRGVVIKGIIDNRYTKVQVDDYNVFSFDEVEDGAKIFITVADKEANKDIIDQIRKKHLRTKTVTYSELCIDKPMRRYGIGHEWSFLRTD